MTQKLNWAGQPIRDGEGYGGRPENIPKTWSNKAAQSATKQHQHYAAITAEDLAEIFGRGAFKLSRSKAAKLLEARTNAHRTSCYRALRLTGRFGQHLHSDGAMLSWR
jgi:hypothetical protein